MLTSCRRFDLLRQTIKSFLQFAYILPTQFIIVEVMPRREGDPAIVFCNPQKACEVLGFVAEHTELKDIIADAWAWEKR